MHHLRAALWGAVSALVAMALAGPLYGMLSSSPMPLSDARFLVFAGVSGWFLYLVPALALGVAARLLVRRFGALAGTALTAVLAVLCGAGVGSLCTVGAPHVIPARALGSVAATWGATALVVLALVSRRIAGGRTPSASGMKSAAPV